MANENPGQKAGGGMKAVLRQRAIQRGKSLQDMSVKDEIGSAAGEVYKSLEGKGEMPLKDMKGAMETLGPLFPAALGWLLREEKIEMKVTPSGITVRLM